jgi:hypothetical protein
VAVAIGDLGTAEGFELALLVELVRSLFLMARSSILLTSVCVLLLLGPKMGGCCGRSVVDEWAAGECRRERYITEAGRFCIVSSSSPTEQEMVASARGLKFDTPYCGECNSWGGSSSGPVPYARLRVSRLAPGYRRAKKFGEWNFSGMLDRRAILRYLIKSNARHLRSRFRRGGIRLTFMVIFMKERN